MTWYQGKPTSNLSTNSRAVQHARRIILKVYTHRDAENTLLTAEHNCHKHFRPEINLVKMSVKLVMNQHLHSRIHRQQLNKRMSSIMILSTHPAHSNLLTQLTSLVYNRLFTITGWGMVYY